MNTRQVRSRIAEMKITKSGFLKKVTKLITPYLVIAALLASVCFLLYSGIAGVEAQQPNRNSNTPIDDQCSGKEDGAECQLRGTQNSCRIGRCRGLVCKSEPAPIGTSCPDTDGNPCTLARCSPSGQCDQQSRRSVDGTVCSDATRGCRGGQSCSGGRCLPSPGAGDPSQVQRVSVLDVQVAASQRRVQQGIAFNDCCGGIDDCEEQHLEALVPTAGAPRRTETDGRLPLRRKFCGTVTNYAINDENEDPRDFNINIRPAEPYANFLRGFVRTDETKLEGVDRERFGRVDCSEPGCFSRAGEAELSVRKVIHAELTPDQSFYGADGRFLPIEGNAFNCGAFSSVPVFNKCTKCIDGSDCESELEPHGQRSGAEACVYGVFAYDHGEHNPSSHTRLCCVKDRSHDLPEIHPFDAIWWRHPARNGWIFGVFQDDSNRYSFPHCRESQSNGNTWSQAPRDLTFEFPFRFPRRSAVQRVCLRHVRTTKLRDGTPNIVRPLNVTTGAFVSPQSEVTTLIRGGQRLLEIAKEPGAERETHVRVQGWFEGDDVVGRIVLRVAVGCDDRTQACGRRRGPRDHTQPLFDRLRPTSNLVRFDKDDPGAGFFYAELTFNCDCP
jgi:hypothetical protein